MNDELERSIRAFKNRQIFSSLSLEILAGIPDEELEQTIVDLVCVRIGSDSSREIEVLREQSPGMIAIYTTIMVEAEVDNGGFNQYFWNSEGKLAEMAAEGFHRIGAVPFETLMRRAIRMWESEQPVSRIFRKVATLVSFSESYKYTNMGELDEEFYRLNEAQNLSQHRIDYIRRNPFEFTEPPANQAD